MKKRHLFAAAFAASAVFAGAAFAWAGRPPTQPPMPAQRGGPPPAWLESSTHSGWFDFGGYCWKTGCADYLPPRQRPGLRELRTKVGETLRIHLGFSPSMVSARMIGAKRTTSLRAAAVTRYRVRALGILDLSAKAGAGTVSYVIRLRSR